MRFTFPRPALLPWLLAALSAVMLLVGIFQGDATLITLAAIGIAVGLLAYPAAKLIIGPPPDFSQPGEPSCPPGDDGVERLRGPEDGPHERQ